ncbi:MAG: KGG domain-containing protein [Leptolyngbya sp. IPPAS B-1204]|nr:hypothetical protein [Elainella sp. C42_A2020_010]RNJ69683.1 MAG: hypothetical protein EDM05_08885 [Leptolyngbya sp. IPPAS B-1204]
MTSKQTSNQANKGKQGFASMDPEKQREIASKGGRTSHKGDEPNAKVNDAEDAATDEITDEIEDEGEELDELLDILDEAELTDLDPEEGIEIIDQWHEILNDSGDAELKEIGKSLKQLKKVLSSSKSKPEAIAEALTQLGHQTDEYANNAQRGYKTKLHKLGKSLNKAGKSLEQQEAE